LLKKWGHTFVIANNGEEAVEQWRRSDFDMVLMDVRFLGL
jgi:CheY-like chemotaxis protein